MSPLDGVTRDGPPLSASPLPLVTPLDTKKVKTYRIGPDSTDSQSDIDCHGVTAVLRSWGHLQRRPTILALIFECFL